MIERALALAAAIVVPMALRILPFRATLALCDAWPRASRARASAAALARRVDRWLAWGRGLWRPTCLTRTVVLYAMLRQHGHRPRLHIGTTGPAQEFRAHAWLSLGDLPVGEPDPALGGYRTLLTHGA
ncbi:MAG TPA: lasso peptide biosynthesis B2 protein [Gemmatimonadaceae bacterium]|nr:lasso peptide biosynthesis B2 protein [Gemmatimonadaceae bacterium]